MLDTGRKQRFHEIEKEFRVLLTGLFTERTEQVRTRSGSVEKATED